MTNTLSDFLTFHPAPHAPVAAMRWTRRPLHAEPKPPVLYDHRKPVSPESLLRGPVEWDALPLLLTTAETAGLLRVQPNTLEKWRLTGEGPPFMSIGTGKKMAVRYAKADLRAWLERRIRASTSAPLPTN